MNLARELLDVMNTEKTLGIITKHILNTYLQQSSYLQPYKQQITKFFDKYIGYQNIKAEVEVIYSDMYTKEEMRSMIKFYKTDIGKSILEKAPKGAIMYNTLVTQRIRDNIHELDEIFDNNREEV